MINKKTILNKMKLETAKAVLEHIDISTVRARSLSNLARWKNDDVWCSAFDEWKVLMTSGSDAEVIATMISEDERSTRLRQSSVWTGLLDQEMVTAIKKRVSDEFQSE